MDLKNKNSADDLKLFYPSNKYEDLPAAALMRTRANNLIACNALSIFLESDEAPEERTILDHGLMNVGVPSEASEYYTALNFFRKNYADERNREFFKNSQAMAGLKDLFVWDDRDQYKTYVINSYLGKKENKCEMLHQIADVDLRKVAKMFAENGDYKNGKLIKPGENRDKIDDKIAEMFRGWKTDIVKFYQDNLKEEDEK